MTRTSEPALKGYMKLPSGVPVRAIPPGIFDVLDAARQRNAYKPGYPLGNCRSCNLNAADSSDWSASMRTPAPEFTPKTFTLAPAKKPMSAPVKYGLIAIGALVGFKLLF